MSFSKTLVSETGLKTTIHADTIEKLNELVAAHEPLQTHEGELRLLEQIPPKARELILNQAPAEELLAREPRSDEERLIHMVERVIERRRAGAKPDEAYCFAVAEQFAKAVTSPWLMQKAAFALLKLYEPKIKAVEEKETQAIHDRAMVEGTAVALMAQGHPDPMTEAWSRVAQIQGRDVSTLQKRQTRYNARRRRDLRYTLRKRRKPHYTHRD